MCMPSRIRWPAGPVGSRSIASITPSLFVAGGSVLAMGSLLKHRHLYTACRRLATDASSGSDVAQKAFGTRSSLRSLAKATLIGRLGREPEVQTFDNGRRSVQMSVATNVSEKIDDEWVERPQWHRVFVREGVVGFDYICDLPTGCLVYVEGELRVVKRETLQGIVQYVNVSVTPWQGTVRVLDRAAGGEDDAAF